MNISLKSYYNDYLESQVEGAVLADVSSEKYTCWKIPTVKRVIVHDWHGAKIGTEEVKGVNYIWLGNKGAVYVTIDPTIKKHGFNDVNPKFVHAMKVWVWKKYFNIDLES